MTRLERIVQTLEYRGFTTLQATEIAQKIIKNLDTYLVIQEQRQARFAALMKNAK